MLKKLIVLGSLLLLIGIIGAAFTFKQVFNTEKNTEEQIMKDDYKTIEINAEDIEVNIAPTEDAETTVEMMARSSDYDLMAKVNKDKLMIDVKHEYRKIISYSFFDMTPKLKVSIPEKEYDQLKITTTNGIISLENITSEEVNATSTNGIIKLHDVITKDIMTETENGMIELDNVEGAITGVSTNGKIEFITTDLDRMVNLETTNGVIKVVTEKAPTNATIDANVNNGKVSLFGKTNGHLVTGNGENQITLTAENGMITVKRKEK